FIHFILIYIIITYVFTFVNKKNNFLKKILHSFKKMLVIIVKK
ncbi:hypothetical protein HMPREF9108_00252, partial [Leptotrichia sp. oral taxon 225 str. F0581]